MEEFQNVYRLIYWLSVVISFFLLLNQYVKGKIYANIEMALIFIISLSYGCLFGTRNIDIGTDTEMYWWQYLEVENIEESLSDREPLYSYFLRFLRYFSQEPVFFIFTVAMSYMLGIFLFVKNYTSKDQAGKILFFLLLTSLPFFLSMGINIIRQGLSVFLLLNAYNAFHSKRYKWMFLLIFMSLNFHFTSLVPILIYILVNYLKNIKLGVGLFVLGIILAFFKVSVLLLFSWLPFISSYDPRFSAYITKDKVWTYDVGFKPQFVVFNLVFLIISVYISKVLIRESRLYTRLINYYCISSFLFFMTFQVPYSDRWGIFSWISIPLLLSPLLQMENIKGSVFVFLFSIVIFVFFNIILFVYP